MSTLLAVFGDPLQLAFGPDLGLALLHNLDDDVHGRRTLYSVPRAQDRHQSSAVRAHTHCRRHRNVLHGAGKWENEK